MNRFGSIFITLLMTLCLPSLALAETQLTWYGHSAFKLVTPSGKVLLIDPWIDNPLNKNGKEDLAKLTQVDLILLTHGHSDHLGNGVEIAKKTKAKLVTTADLGKAVAQYAGYPKDQMGFETMGNFGGEISFLDGEVKVAFIPAVHSSGLDSVPDGMVQYGGNPCGLLITVRNGPALYHTGDTDVFTDMTFVSQFHKVDVMLASIGDHFTMGPERAAMAVKIVNPATVVPIHYGTFPMLTGTADALNRALKKHGVKAKMYEMKVGETMKL